MLTYIQHEDEPYTFNLVDISEPKIPPNEQKDQYIKNFLSVY